MMRLLHLGMRHAPRRRLPGSELEQPGQTAVKAGSLVLDIPPITVPPAKYNPGSHEDADTPGPAYPPDFEFTDDSIVKLHKACPELKYAWEISEVWRWLAHYDEKDSYDDKPIKNGPYTDSRNWLWYLEYLEKKLSTTKSTFETAPYGCIKVPYPKKVRKKILVKQKFSKKKLERKMWERKKIPTMKIAKFKIVSDTTTRKAFQDIKCNNALNKAVKNLIHVKNTLEDYDWEGFLHFARSVFYASQDKNYEHDGYLYFGKFNSEEFLPEKDTDVIERFEASNSVQELWKEFGSYVKDYPITDIPDSDTDSD